MDTTNDATASCWMTEPADARASLAADAQADVCVIGGGIAGLSTAYLLALEGRSVMVLDAGPVGGGQTQRTTAHLSNAIDDRYQEIERIHGQAMAQAAAASHTAAIDRIETIVRDEAIACDFRRLDGYLLLSADQSSEFLAKELQACHNAGLTQVELLHRMPLGAISYPVALRFPNQGQFHPLKYLNGLAAAIERRGGRICTGTMVTQLDGGSQAGVQTAAGPVVRCQHIVVATNTPFNDRVALHTKQAAYRTYALAAAMPAGSLAPALWWDTADPYHYLRLAGPSAPGGELLIIGGEDHKTGQESNPAACLARLEEWARRHFPMLGAVEYSWSGQVLETVDGLAFIGRNPLDQPNVYVATGDSGMGMTHGTIAGQLLTDLIQGREHPWAAVYDPRRKRLGAAGTFARENLNVARQYGDWLNGSEVSSVDEIPPEGAALLRRGLRMLAVYRDRAGQLVERSAVCPHLGCVVHWNNLEKSWDCPCHGSRFDRTGCVITGPAVSNLENFHASNGAHPAHAGVPAQGAQQE